MTRGDHIKTKKAFFFDLDGCIYKSNDPAEGSRELLNQIREDGRILAFITNNSRQTAGEISAKLKQMGIEAREEEIFPATDYVGDYIFTKYGCKKIKVAGSQSLEEAVRRKGHQVLTWEDKEQAEILVVGRDTSFTYQKLEQMVRVLSQGSLLIGANADASHPGPDGHKVPETGTLVLAIEHMAGCKAEYVGKPESFLFERVIRHYGLQASQCVMIGDNYHTDIIGGWRAGMDTIWIKEDEQGPGEQDLSVLNTTLIVRSMGELLHLYNNSSNRGPSVRLY